MSKGRKPYVGLRCGICGAESGNTDTCVACMLRIIDAEKREVASRRDEDEGPEPW